MPLAHPHQPTGRHGLVGTFDAEHLWLGESRRALDKSRRGRAEHHPTRRCHRLHPLRHADLLTDGGITERSRTDFTGDHLTGVKSHAQLQIHAVALLDVDGKPLRLFLNAQGRQTGAGGVVLQRHRCAEHRHDAVTGELVDRAAVPLHNCRAAVGEVGHDLAQPLGTHRRGNLHRMHHVGEQDGDLLVFGGFRARRNGCTALATELGLLVQFGAARPA